eukprot:2782448-Rhodomonas_salina.1
MRLCVHADPDSAAVLGSCRFRRSPSCSRASRSRAHALSRAPPMRAPRPLAPLDAPPHAAPDRGRARGRASLRGGEREDVADRAEVDDAQGLRRARRQGGVLGGQAAAHGGGGVHACP